MIHQQFACNNDVIKSIKDSTMIDCKTRNNQSNVSIATYWTNWKILFCMKAKKRLKAKTNLLHQYQLNVNFNEETKILFDNNDYFQSFGNNLK